MADYSEVVIDLSAVSARRELIAPGRAVDSIYINGALPGGVAFKIHCGSRPGLELRSYSSLELCPPETEGIYLTTVGVAAQAISVLLGTGLFVQGAP